MLDPKILRESPAILRAAIAKKHLAVDLDGVLALDTAWRALLTEVEGLRARQKAANNEMAALKKGSAEFSTKVQEMKAVSAEVKAKEEGLKSLEEKWHTAMLTLPNIPHTTVPDGKTPEQNKVHATHGSVDAASNHATPHWEIPGFSNLIDFARGAKVTGAGFPFFIGDGAKLVRALLQFFLDEDVKAGYTEVSPPIFVNAASATATGQLPDKEGQMYETTPDRLYAVPTAQVPLTNFSRSELLDEDALPVCRCAYTPCFRREAGSYGKDVRGLNRVHQVDKVEVVQLVDPAKSYEVLEEMVLHVEKLLQSLDLPYRILRLCGGDMGFTSAMTYDFEVYSAAQEKWLEVSSVSNFEAFQTNRMKIRFKDTAGKTQLVHSLNGSSLALPRIVACLLENHQAEAFIALPEVLHSYFGAGKIG